MIPSLRSFVLLLTATVDPGATPMVVRSDPQVRLRDYQHSLLVWLNSGSIQKIVVYENSGHDLASLEAIARKFPKHEVEFHSFRGNQDGSSKGKGYSELSGISRTIERSASIAGSDLIVKCTGRLTVRNAGELFESIRAQEHFDIMCTLKGNLTIADSRLFVATPAFITQYLAAQQESINDVDGVYLEHALACATARAIADRRRWLPFPIFPRIEGISGSLGVSLSGGILRSLFKPAYHRVRNIIYRR